MPDRYNLVEGWLYWSVLELGLRIAGYERIELCHRTALQALIRLKVADFDDDD